MLQASAASFACREATHHAGSNQDQDHAEGNVEKAGPEDSKGPPIVDNVPRHLIFEDDNLLCPQCKAHRKHANGETDQDCDT